MPQSPDARRAYHREAQAKRRLRLREEGKLPPKPTPLWHDAHPAQVTAVVPVVVKVYLATPEGRQAVLALALKASSHE
jgi:hypothetical protein